MSRFLEADDGVALSPCVGLDSITESCEHPVVSYLSLIVVCMASWKVAFFVAKWMALPRGSGFLLTGLLANAVSMLDNHSCHALHIACRTRTRLVRARDVGAHRAQGAHAALATRHQRGLEGATRHEVRLTARCKACRRPGPTLATASPIMGRSSPCISAPNARPHRATHKSGTTYPHARWCL